METTTPLVENEAEAYEILEYNFFKASVYLLFMSEQHEMLIRTTTSGGVESIIQFTNVIYDKEDISKTEVSYGYAFRLNGKSMDVDPFFHAMINMKIGWEVMTKYFEFWDNFIRNKLLKSIDNAAADIANFEPLFAMALDQIFSPIAALEGDVVSGGGKGPGPELGPGPKPKPPQGVHKYIPSPIQKIMEEPPIPDSQYHEGGVGSISHEQEQQQGAGSAGQIGEIKQQKPKTKNIEEGTEEAGKQQEGEKTKKKPERHEKEFEKPSVEGEGGEGKGAGKSKKGKPSKGGKGGGKEKEKEEEKQPLMLSTEQLEQLIEERKELRKNG